MLGNKTVARDTNGFRAFSGCGSLSGAMVEFRYADAGVIDKTMTYLMAIC